MADGHDDVRRHIASLELRHGRLRCEIAAVELAFGETAVAAGYINVETALSILDDCFDDLAGTRP